MATILDLKEHLENGGKIRRPSWGKRNYIYIDDDDDLIDEEASYFCDKQLLLDDWEVYEEPFEITHTGLYRTRDGRMALVSSISNYDDEFYGVIEGENHNRLWDKKGYNLNGKESPDDIVSEWED